MAPSYFLIRTNISGRTRQREPVILCPGLFSANKWVICARLSHVSEQSMHADTAVKNTNHNQWPILEPVDRFRRRCASCSWTSTRGRPWGDGGTPLCRPPAARCLSHNTALVKTQLVCKPCIHLFICCICNHLHRIDFNILFHRCSDADILHWQRAATFIFFSLGACTISQVSSAPV